MERPGGSYHGAELGVRVGNHSITVAGQVLVTSFFLISVGFLVVSTFIATSCNPMDHFVLRDVRAPAWYRKAPLLMQHATCECFASLWLEFVQAPVMQSSIGLGLLPHPEDCCHTELRIYGGAAVAAADHVSSRPLTQEAEFKDEAG